MALRTKEWWKRERISRADLHGAGGSSFFPGRPVSFSFYLYHLDSTGQMAGQTLSRLTSLLQQQQQ